MRSEKEIDEMYSFIGYFNDGLFMNKDYRKGLLDGLAFAKGFDEKLTKIKNDLKEKLQE